MDKILDGGRRSSAIVAGMKKNEWPRRADEVNRNFFIGNKGKITTIVHSITIVHTFLDYNEIGVIYLCILK